mmetsp:Transcript_36197/g.84881  ORF Transcript_36197/g.84881 Transcript_36197/m.84881 type:complete len:238 (+) Transcript_36197:89-802(+)
MRQAVQCNCGSHLLHGGFLRDGRLAASVELHCVVPCNLSILLIFFFAFGTLISLVAPGNGTLTPCFRMIGFHSSGTSSCITGLERYLSMWSSNPCKGSLQMGLHATSSLPSIVSRGHSSKSKNEMKDRQATSGVTKLTNAYPSPLPPPKSRGKYTKSYMHSKPSRSRTFKKTSRDMREGRFLNMTVVLSVSRKTLKFASHGNSLSFACASLSGNDRIGFVDKHRGGKVSKALGYSKS